MVKPVQASISIYVYTNVHEHTHTHTRMQRHVADEWHLCVGTIKYWQAIEDHGSQTEVTQTQI